MRVGNIIMQSVTAVVCVFASVAPGVDCCAADVHGASGHSKETALYDR